MRRAKTWRDSMCGWQSRSSTSWVLRRTLTTTTITRGPVHRRHITQVHHYKTLSTTSETQRRWSSTAHRPGVSVDGTYRHSPPRSYRRPQQKQRVLEQYSNTSRPTLGIEWKNDIHGVLTLRGRATGKLAENMCMEMETGKNIHSSRQYV
jgi:hypothetical protein